MLQGFLEEKVNSESEIIRLQYKYRRLILSGRADLPLRDAIKLVGPDTAYRLYRGSDPRKGALTPEKAESTDNNR